MMYRVLEIGLKELPEAKRRNIRKFILPVNDRSYIKYCISPCFDYMCEEVLPALAASASSLPTVGGKTKMRRIIAKHAISSKESGQRQERRSR